MQFQSIDIGFNTNIFFLAAGFLSFAAFTFYIYKYTIPNIPRFPKIILVALRSLVLILLFLLILEPKLSFISSEKVIPVSYLFIDNSNSLAVKDSSARLEIIKQFVSDLTGGNSGIEIKSFAHSVQNLTFDSIEVIKLNGRSTNFYNLVSELKNNDKKISSAVIISDGILNDGSNPIFEIEKLPFPIYTVGIGDTSRLRDIQIKDINFNQYIYKNKATKIDALINHFGFAGSPIRASLLSEGKVVGQKDIILNESGFANVEFDFTPVQSGENKMSVSINNLNGESNFYNNSKTFFIEVLEDRIKIALIAGSPSPDVSAFANALDSEKDFEVKKIIQISQNKFWKDFRTDIIDSSDILFLIDFPSKNISSSLFSNTLSSIRQKQKPFFLLYPQNPDNNLITEMKDVLPFTVQNPSNDFLNVQADAAGQNFSSSFVAFHRNDVWKNLPPLIKSNSEFKVKAGSDVLLYSVARNTLSTSPLLITRNVGNSKTIAFLAGNIWKWELLGSEKYPGFFYGLIKDFARWLNISNEQKQFTIRTSKKNYTAGEPVEFTAELYDQTFVPVDSAEIIVNISKNEKTFSLNLREDKNGIYSGSFENTELGDFYFNGIANFNGIEIESNAGRFSVGQFNLEKENTRADFDFLKQLAASTNATFYNIDNTDGLREKILSLNDSSANEKFHTSEIQLLGNEWIMLIIIVLFGTEWLIRKRNGML